MNETEFITMVEEILEVEHGTVSLDDSLEERDWDSLCNITFVAEADTRTGASIDADTLSKASTVRDLYDLINQAASAS